MAVKLRKSKTTNKELFVCINDLRKLSNQVGVMLFRAVAKKLSCSSKNRAIVNLTKIDKHTKKDESVIIPGKVLGSGSIKKPVHIISFDASKSAIEKIHKAKGTFTQLGKFAKSKPKIKPKMLV